MGGAKTPKTPAPTIMPDPEDPNIAIEKRRKTAQASSASGRAATLLSGGSGVDKLGN